MKKIFVSLTGVYLTLTAARLEAAEAQHDHEPAATNRVEVTPNYLNQLIDEMAERNPALRAKRERTNAAAANIGAVRTWADPMVHVGGVGARESFRASDGDLIYGVEQKLPLFGKPKAARQLAQQELKTETATAD